MQLDISKLSPQDQALFSALYANALHASNENYNSTSGQNTSGGESSSGGNQHLVSNSNPIVATGIESKTHQEIKEEEEEKNEETGNLFADLVNLVAKTDSEDQKGKLSKDTSPLTKGKEDSNTNPTDPAAADREEGTKVATVPILSKESVTKPVDTSDTNNSSSGLNPIVVPLVNPTVPTGTVTDNKKEGLASGDTGSGTTNPIIPKTLSVNQTGSGDQRIPNPSADANATGNDKSDTGSKSGSSGGNSGSGDPFSETGGNSKPPSIHIPVDHFGQTPGGVSSSASGTEDSKPLVSSGALNASQEKGSQVRGPSTTKKSIGTEGSGFPKPRSDPRDSDFEVSSGESDTSEEAEAQFADNKSKQATDEDKAKGNKRKRPLDTEARTNSNSNSNSSKSDKPIGKKTREEKGLEAISDDDTETKQSKQASAGGDKSKWKPKEQDEDTKRQRVQYPCKFWGFDAATGRRDCSREMAMSFCPFAHLHDPNILFALACTLYYMYSLITCTHSDRYVNVISSPVTCSLYHMYYPRLSVVELELLVHPYTILKRYRFKPSPSYVIALVRNFAPPGGISPPPPAAAAAGGPGPNGPRIISFFSSSPFSLPPPTFLEQGMDVMLVLGTVVSFSCLF